MHLFDRLEREFAEESLRPVTSYQEFLAGLDYAVDRVVKAWRENQRRSDRGR
jgi:hypothetical protein